MKDQDARGWYVYNTLNDHADRTQAGLRALLTAQGVAFQPFWAANMIVAEARPQPWSTCSPPAPTWPASTPTPRQHWIEDPAIANCQPATDSPDTRRSGACST